MTDLSVIIPARNEEFLGRTIEDILENIEGDTEIIAICDGYWPVPSIPDHPKVTIVHHTESIGQRAAVNEGARISQAKFVMKIDGHCAVDKGFDVKLMRMCRRSHWTLIPKMYNLHAFDLECKKCGNRTYQAPDPKACKKCQSTDGFNRIMVWKPRLKRQTVSWRFDNQMHFQYWHQHVKRNGNQGDLLETMSFIGACWFIHRKQYWKLEGLDEGHGGWGQVGTEVACKTWLSGGKLLTVKNTWFGHMFRTQFGFPYPLSGNAQKRAQKYSRDLWLNDRWEGAKYPLSWLVERFAPVPGWKNEK